MTLVQTAAGARKVINIILGVIVLYIVFVTFKPLGARVYYSFFPPKDMPNALFGQLEPLEFVEKNISNTTNPRYELNTTNGRLPTNLPNRLPVYRFKQAQFSYQGGTLAEINAQRLGFTKENLTSDLRGTEYAWRNRIKQRQLTIDTLTRHLNLQTDLSGKSQHYTRINQSEDSDKSKARNFLSSINRLDNGLDQAEYLVTYGKITNQSLASTQVANEVQVARVDLIRKVDSYKILGPNPKVGIVNLTFGSVNNQHKESSEDLIELKYSVYEIQIERGQSKAIYPLISVADAWAAVSRQNKGVIANIQPQGTSVLDTYAPTRIDQILISEIYLAYYETNKYQKYLQPIYVFEGAYTVANRPGGEITIYFPAVDGNFVQRPAIETTSPSN